MGEAGEGQHDAVMALGPVQGRQQILGPVDLVRCRGKLGKAKGCCKVGDDVVSEAEVSFVLMES